MRDLQAMIADAVKDDLCTIIPVRGATEAASGGTPIATNENLSSVLPTDACLHYRLGLLYMGSHTIDFELFFPATNGAPDFVLCPAVPLSMDPSMPSKPPTIIDYSWITTEPPSWDDADSTSLTSMVRWLLKNYGKYQQERFINMTKTNERLGFEYAVSLASLGDAVSYLVGDDNETVSLRLSLFQDNTHVFRRLENALVLYEKLMSYPLLGETELQAIVSDEPSIGFHYMCTLKVNHTYNNLIATQEKVTMFDHVKERTELLQLLGLLNLCTGLPTFSSALSNGQGFIDFLPVLEDSINNTKIDELMHWLEMVMALVGFFGDPLEMNPFPLAEVGGPAIHRSASFMVTDSTSNMSIIISLTYEGLTPLPQAEYASAHHCFGNDGEPIRIRYKFPDGQVPPVITPGEGRSPHLDVVWIADRLNQFLEEVFPKLSMICSENAKN